MGLLTIKGKELHVSRLTLEKGEVDIEGTIDSMVYSSNEALRSRGNPCSPGCLSRQAMSSRIQYEAWLMVLSLVTGGWLMLAYDTLRVFRLIIRHGPFWTGAEDFLYWLYAGLVTFILLYEQNDGVFRAYVIGGVFAGMILYDRFISRIFFKCLKKAGKCLRMIISRHRQKAVCSPEKDGAGD